MSDIKFEIIKKIAETRFKYKDLGKITDIDSNSPPSVFIGSKLKYPSVNVGILSPIERDDNAWVYDNAKYWAKSDFKIRDVLNLRNSLLNSRFKSNVTAVRSDSSKFLNLAKEIALSSRPVDIEIELNKKIGPGMNRDRVLAPQGMRAEMKKARIVGNVKIEKKIEKVVNDDLKASDGMKYLYKNNFDEYTLSKILSIGALGLKKDKRLVPTRWSITATDDLISKGILERVRGYKWIENHELFFGEFMGNCYLIMLFPNVWSYELFELYLPGSSWNPDKEIKAATDYENFGGRKDYASATAGGYYASRLPILQYLDKIKKQASVIAIRIELPSYWAALGVWVVRESVRKALDRRKLEFRDFNDLIDSTNKIGMIKFGFDSSKILKKSKLLESLKTQTHLGKWF
ncbi:MAG: hypothetical protein Q8P81_04515 [Nanoarchaeota archaeon]|nr:hypothetical protein [Nanoarchaeota archaeon]